MGLPPIRPALAALCCALAGCAAEAPDYDPGVDAGDFVGGVTNPFLPLAPGARWVYEAQTDEGSERIEVTVLRETKVVMGVTATVVRDVVLVDGELREDTFDWYAQDRAGNVWYLGEDTTEYEDGAAVGKGGSWQWGVDGALPGIAMKADPAPGGEAYFMEFYPGEAMDEASVIARGRTVTTPAGTYRDTVTTKEWTRLEPGVEEEADYARGVGLVAKQAAGGVGREALVSHSPA